MGTRWTRSWTASLLVAGMAGGSALTVGASPDVGTAVPVIVDGTSSDLASAAVRAAGGVVEAPLDLIGGVAAAVPAGAISQLTAAGFLVVPDRTFAPVDEQREPDGEDVDSANEQVLALHPGTVGGSGAGAGVTVGLIDTGVYPHPDLAGRLRAGVDLTRGIGEAGDALVDGYGHGTFLAGLIAGTHTGVAPGADIVSIKVADATGETTLRTLIQAIGWAVVHQEEEGIDVLNLSFSAVTGLPAASDPLVQAVEAAWASGLLVVVASGNEGPGTVTSPGTSSSALTVGATDHGGSASPSDDVLAPWSGSVNRPTPKPEVVAPGTSLISLGAPGSVVAAENAENDDQVPPPEGYVFGSGTSMSTALVSGAAAVVLAAHPGATPGDVKSALVDTADPIAGDAADTIDIEGASTTTAVPGETGPTPGRSKGEGDGAVVGSVNGWEGARWTGARWTTARWTGARWTDEAWEAMSWAGARWTGARWTGARWTGARWTGARWTGARWTGARWTMVDDGSGSQP